MRTATKKLIIPTPEESKLALKTLEVLPSDCLKSDHVKLQFKVRGGSSQSVEIPSFAIKPLIDILRHTASGHAVSFVPIRQEVTTQEAAEILNVSRPFVIGLLEKHEIPFRLVGTHRRIPLLALLQYKRRTSAIREEALDFLAAQAQELKLY
jgi:excisionase family DNA binding protein